MVKGSAFHCAVSPHSLKEQEEGKSAGTEEVNILRVASVVENQSKAPKKRRVAEIVLTLVWKSWKVLAIEHRLKSQG